MILIHYQRDLAELTAQDSPMWHYLHAEDGGLVNSLHCGITRKTIEQIRKAQAQDEHRELRRFSGACG